MSAICQEFGCTPSQALHENPQLVFGIMEYRRFHYAHAHKDDVSQLTQQHAELWKEVMNDG